MARTELPKLSAKRVIRDLNDLRKLTGTRDGAQRVAWGPVWDKARGWFAKMVKRDLGLAVRKDSANNWWVTIPGQSKKSVIIAGHLDSVPNGGWLDGCLGTLSALEVLRRYKAAGMRPPVTLHLCDWADEEGARFGRSLVGSSAAGGTLDPVKELGHLKDRAGIRQLDAMAKYGVKPGTIMNAHKELKALKANAYLELHIEQGPNLESMKQSAAAVLGTFGVERHMIHFSGQAAHSGSTPIPFRRDAFLSAAEFALECRKIGLKYSGKDPTTRVVATCGIVKVEPCFVTAIPGEVDISLDMRALDATVLAKMLAAAKKAAVAAAKKNSVKMTWNRLWTIEPRLFDKKLVQLACRAIKEVTGESTILPSGPLHDAAEMQPHMPTVMMFAQSSPGLSHCKEEDTPIAHLDATIRSFLRLADLTVENLSNQARSGVIIKS